MLKLGIVSPSHRNLNGQDGQNRLTLSDLLLDTYEITQKVVKFPEPTRSSSLGKSDCGDDNDSVVVGSVENHSKDVVESRANIVLSRLAKRSIPDGVWDLEVKEVARLVGRAIGPEGLA